MRKLLVSLLASVMLITLAGCSGDKVSDAGSDIVSSGASASVGETSTDGDTVTTEGNSLK